MTSQKPTQPSLHFLDGIRGLAAFHVMVGHARWLLWEGYSQGYITHPELYSLPHKLLMYFFSTFIFGHQAVVLFFVLSGFVIHLRYSKNLKLEGSKSKFDWLSFVGRRMKRLYPPLIFAMLLTLLLDTIGRSLQYPIYFQQTPYSLINNNILSHLEPQTAIGTLLFVGKIYVPEWGSNGPLWSLTFEWWFYMFYPLFWLLSKRSIALATITLLICFALSFFSALPILRIITTTFSAMIIWWFGVLLADIFTGRLNISFSKVALLIIFLPIALIYKRFIPDSSPLLVFDDVIWGLGFTGGLAACFVWQQHNKSLRLLKLFKPLGDFSYTLYVTHFPILVLMSGYLMSQSTLLPQEFGWVFLGIAICVSFAYGAYQLVEKPFVSSRTHSVTTATTASPS